tara:strand:+ start:535 stop:831 length:297 start_codon:yes stop_codon:yes gene_type:complete
MKKYKIISNEYHDEYGKGYGESFYVKELKSFLFLWTRWSYIQHMEFSWGDCYNVRTKFKTVQDARDFIKDIMCTGNERNKTHVRTVEEHDCTTINQLK